MAQKKTPATGTAADLGYLRPSSQRPILNRGASPDGNALAGLPDQRGPASNRGTHPDESRRVKLTGEFARKVPRLRVPQGEQTGPIPPNTFGGYE